ncbi:MAG: hypothetical protein ACI4MF_05510, partial [Candidatus Faecivicinus sp.]
RLVPGVLGCAESGEDESFSTGLLEYPQYTRPAEYCGLRVPEVLLGGNHADINAWRREQSLSLTRERRPDLLDTAPLDDSDRALLAWMEASDAAVSALKGAGIAAHRLGFAEADAFPKRWFQAFIPEISRRAARKQCFSGRRHVGWLWQAFSMDFAPHQDGDGARDALSAHLQGPCLCYLPDSGVLLRLDAAPNPKAIAPLQHFILADEALRFTYVQPHKPGFGPYFAERS